MITFKQSGNFNNTEKFFSNVQKKSYDSILEKYAKQGLSALISATPVDSGETANSWAYEIKKTAKGVSVTWINSHIVNGAPIAIILQYGHATRNGGYVEGRDYINPAIRPIFDKMAQDLLREVNR